MRTALNASKFLPAICDNGPRAITMASAGRWILRDSSRGAVGYPLPKVIDSTPFWEGAE
jgi:hypothetical protein